KEEIKKPTSSSSHLTPSSSSSSNNLTGTLTSLRQSSLSASLTGTLSPPIVNPNLRQPESRLLYLRRAVLHVRCSFVAAPSVAASSLRRHSLCLSRRQPFGVALLIHRWCLPPSTLRRYRPPLSRHPSVSEAHRVSLLRVFFSVSSSGMIQGCLSGVGSMAQIISPLILSPLTALFLSEEAPFYSLGFRITCIGLAMV
ncbi:hypothetical protein PIB30_035651, partial [Stylosanthes scabra]|nr:hypothetical protein [Stylosanthes scabra]